MKQFAKQKTILMSIAGISGFIAVALGAYGSHGLKAEPDLYNSFSIASKYHFMHTIAIIALASVVENKSGIIALWMFVLGILLFSGGIYVAVIFKIPGFTMITPFGGITFMAGWLLFAISKALDYKNVDFQG